MLPTWRTIDIDILLYGVGSKTDEPFQHIPHPRLTERAFALKPLIDVMPDAVIGSRSAKEWLTLVDATGLHRVAEPGWHKPR